MGEEKDCGVEGEGILKMPEGHGVRRGDQEMWMEAGGAGGRWREPGESWGEVGRGGRRGGSWARGGAPLITMKVMKKQTKQKNKNGGQG